MLVHGEHLVHDLQLLPPAPLLLGAAELVEGQLGHELPRRHAGKVGGGLQHLAAVYGHIRSDSISRLCYKPVENFTTRHLETVQLGKSIQPAGEDPTRAAKTDLHTDDMRSIYSP